MKLTKEQFIAVVLVKYRHQSNNSYETLVELFASELQSTNENFDNLKFIRKCHNHLTIMKKISF